MWGSCFTQCRSSNSKYSRYLPNFFEDGVLVIAFYPSYIITLSIKLEAKNYRPISLLLLILKVIEESLHDQTQDYLQRNELLKMYQSGFRSSNSKDLFFVSVNGHDFKQWGKWQTYWYNFNQTAKGSWHLRS